MVIPSYRHAPYVEAALRSALACGHGSGPADEGPAVEVVVVDDGSDDGSVEILRRLEREIGDASRLRVLVQENAGAHAAIGRGIGEARAPIVAILDSDDLFEPRRLARLLPVFDDPDVVLAATWLRIIDSAGDELGVKHAWRDLPPWPRAVDGPGLAELGDPTLALLEQNWVSTTSNFVFRRSLVEPSSDRIDFRPLRYAHDWDFLLEASARGRIALVEDDDAREALVGYRVHASNTIAESDGQGLMRFEILWLLARHAPGVLRRSAERLGRPLADLEIRAWRSLPRVGADPAVVEALWLRLLALRGAGDRAPAAYDALLEPTHPLRRRAVEALA